jgi:peroxiredoxin
MRAFVLAMLAGCASCAAPAPRLEQVPNIRLLGAAGESIDLRRAAATARLSVLVFFSPHCRCLDQHEPRLRRFYAAYEPRGVRFFMIDSEVGASPERDAVEAQKRGYPFPILLDPGGRLADLLGAEYATYSVVLDADGRVRYGGGIDTDKTHLNDNAIPYLKSAVDDLLAGREPRLASAKALGCALEKW